MSLLVTAGRRRGQPSDSPFRPRQLVGKTNDYLSTLARERVIAKVVYPVPDPSAAARQVDTWLLLNRRRIHAK